MIAGLKFTLEGLGPLQFRLKEMTGPEARRVIRSGMKPAAEIIKEEAKRLAPINESKFRRIRQLMRSGGKNGRGISLTKAIQKTSKIGGQLRRSIVVRSMGTKDRSKVGFLVQARRTGVNRAYYADWVNWGHKKVLWGKRTGETVKGLKFFNKALARKRSEATAVAVRIIRAGLLKLGGGS